MQRRTTRRSALRVLGATGIVALAGCSALQNDDNSSQTTESPSDGENGSNNQGTAEENDEEDATDTSEDIQLREVEVEGAIVTAFTVDGELTYVVENDDGSRYIQQGDTKHPEYDSGLDDSDREYFIEDGDLFYDATREDGTTVVMKNDEVFREDVTRLHDVDEGDPIIEDDEIWFVGEEEIVPDEKYEEIDHVGKIDGEIFYEGYWIGEDREFDTERPMYDIVRGGEVIDGSQLAEEGGYQRDVRGPDVVGETFYYLASESDGPRLVVDGEPVGNQYTSHGSGGGGEFNQVFDVDGELGFIATVAHDKRETGAGSEMVLWIGGEEITRADHLTQPKIVNGKLTYTGVDAEGNDFFLHGDTDLDERVREMGDYKEANYVTEVDGEIAIYADLEADAVDNEDKNKVLLYRGQEFGPYTTVSDIHEYEGGLMFIGREELDYSTNKLFVQAN